MWYKILNTNVKENYFAPEAELIKIENIDVITTSYPDENGGSSNPLLGPWIQID